MWRWHMQKREIHNNEGGGKHERRLVRNIKRLFVCVRDGETGSERRRETSKEQQKKANGDVWCGQKYSELRSEEANQDKQRQLQQKRRKTEAKSDVTKHRGERKYKLQTRRKRRREAFFYHFNGWLSFPPTESFFLFAPLDDTHSVWRGAVYRQPQVISVSPLQHAVTLTHCPWGRQVQCWKITLCRPG